MIRKWFYDGHYYFFFVEFWYDIIRDDTAVQFNNGYSVLHFCVMYMLGRCFFLYKDDVLKISSWKWITGYLVCIVIMTVFFFFNVPKCWAYSNPLVILASFCFFAPFVKKNFYNKWINWFAESTLPVFIMHTLGVFYAFLILIAKNAYQHYDYWQYCLIIFAVQLGVFVVCVLYDHARRLLFDRYTNSLYNKLEKIIQKCQVTH